MNGLAITIADRRLILSVGGAIQAAQNLANLTAEITRATQAEAAIAASVATEVSARQLAVSAEFTRATGAEAAIAGNLATEVSARQVAVSAEATRAELAEQAISGVLENEISRAEIAEAAITGSVTTEVTNRSVADAQLQASKIGWTDVATDADALAGTATNKVMTPETVLRALQAYALSLAASSDPGLGAFVAALAAKANNDLSGVMVTSPVAGAVARPVTSKIADRNSLLDFGAPVATDFTAVISAAEASTPVGIELPEGVYKTTANFYALKKRYSGAGQLSIAAGIGDGSTYYKQARDRSFLLYDPGSYNLDDRTKTFDGDFSRTHTVGYKFDGPLSSGASTGSYKNLAASAISFRVLDYVAGHNVSSVNNIDRSGAFGEVVRAFHGGQGDHTGRHYYGQVYSTLSGVQHWLASPAIAAHNGNISATSSAFAAYLQESEYSTTDGGAAVTAVDRTRNYSRTNGGTTVHQIWAHDRPQSVGSVAMDVAYSPSGLFDSILDTAAASLGPEGAAVVLKAAEYVYFGCTPITDPQGVTYRGDPTSYKARVGIVQGRLIVDLAGGTGLIINNLPTSAAGLPAGSIYSNSGVLTQV